MVKDILDVLKLVPANLLFIIGKAVIVFVCSLATVYIFGRMFGLVKNIVAKNTIAVIMSILVSGVTNAYFK